MVDRKLPRKKDRKKIEAEEKFEGSGGGVRGGKE